MDGLINPLSTFPLFTYHKSEIPRVHVKASRLINASSLVQPIDLNIPEAAVGILKIIARIVAFPA